MAFGDSSLSLSELFYAGWNLQKRIDSAELVASSKDFSIKVTTAVQQLEEATRLVSRLGLFSSNETIEEVSTTDLKYILLPALLGDLVPQLVMAQGDDRIGSLQTAQVYFVDFLQRCKDYAITSEEVPSLNDSSSNSEAPEPSRVVKKPKTMEQLAMERREKIVRLKAKKEMENKLRELDKVIQSCDSSRQPDDETTREHILTLLRLWVYKALENLHSINQEIDLLTQMKQVKQDLPVEAVSSTVDASSRPPMKPFVITKDMLKGKVFGAGYPSLPTMTVEEFYEQTYQNQAPPPPPPTANEDESSEESQLEEEERLKKEREFDEFKDVNRRGWGNRKNQG